MAWKVLSIKIVSVLNAPNLLEALDSKLPFLSFRMTYCILISEKSIFRNETTLIADIIETPIHTVYIEGNHSSHFHPLIDALRIYKEIAKFGLSSLICTAVDIGVFAAVQRLLSTYHLSYALLGATVIARLCSSGLNFYLNKNVVFASKGRTYSRVVKYYTLCIVQMLCSWMLLRWLTLWGVGNIIILKILVDTGLFFLSFSAQRVLIFGGLSRAKSV